MEYVYVADFGDSVKIGYSTNVQKRMKQLESLRGRRVKSLYYEKAERPTERQLHYHFRERRTEGEYFAIPFEDAKRILADAVANPEKYALPKRTYTEALKRAQKNYIEKFSRVEIRMTTEKRNQVKAHAEAHGESVNAFINRAVDETMVRDNGSQEAP